MSDEPYKAKKIPNHWPTSEKRSVVGKMVAISGLRLHHRGTKLIFPRSRSFPKYTIVEITLTDEQDVEPGDTVDSVLYLGFFEVVTGGIVVAGQLVKIEGAEIGTVAGFSDVHEPNHLNLLVQANQSMIQSYMTDTSDASMVKTKLHLEHEVVFGS
ncbi:MAG: hypothetical protein RTV31_14295 [Candidatus Thorarchaeota archaeon]